MKTRNTVIIMACLMIASCDRVGSESWCEKQGQIPKTQWTLEDAGNYTRYCVLGMDSENWCEELEQKPKGDWTANEAADYAENCIIGRDNHSD